MKFILEAQGTFRIKGVVSENVYEVEAEVKDYLANHLPRRDYLHLAWDERDLEFLKVEELKEESK